MAPMNKSISSTDSYKRSKFSTIYRIPNLNIDRQIRIIIYDTNFSGDDIEEVAEFLSARKTTQSTVRIVTRET